MVGSYIFHACIPRPFARSMKIKISICFSEPIAQLHLYFVHVYQSNTALRFCGIMSMGCGIHGTIPGRDCPPDFYSEILSKIWVNFCFSEYNSELWHVKGLVPFTQLIKVRRECLFWHLRASDCHETFTRSSLALNMIIKLVSDP